MAASPEFSDWDRRVICERSALGVLKPDPRVPVDKAGLADQARNFAFAAYRAAKALVTGQPVLVSEEVHVQRLETCLACEHWTGRKCDLCGCRGLKLHMATERCPIAKWDRVEVSNEQATV